MEDMKNMFLKELAELNEKYQSSQQALEALQKQSGFSGQISK